MATGNICAHLVATKTTADDFKWGLKRWVEDERERGERETDNEKERESERQIRNWKEREKKRYEGIE